LLGSFQRQPAGVVRLQDSGAGRKLRHAHAIVGTAFGRGMERARLVVVGRSVLLLDLSVCFSLDLEMEPTADDDGLGRPMAPFIVLTGPLLLRRRSWFQRLPRHRSAVNRLAGKTGRLQSAASLSGVSSRHRIVQVVRPEEAKPTYGSISSRKTSPAGSRLDRDRRRAGLRWLDSLSVPSQRIAGHPFCGAHIRASEYRFPIG